MPLTRSRSLFFGLLFLALASLPRLGLAAFSSAGTEFWLAFPYNTGGTGTLTLSISSVTNTSATVTIPGLGFSSTVAVPASGIVTVTLPSSVMLAMATSVAEAKENKGIHVVAVQPVTVYGLNRVASTTDGFLGLPVDALGKTYRVLGYANSYVSSLGFDLMGSLLAVVGTQNGTTVTITPKQAVGTHPAGVAFSVGLNAGETLQLSQNSDSNGDLTGTLLSADKPVAAFGGHACANVPAENTYCDHLIEQMFPLTTWGKNFVTYPLATRLAGDTFRILADQANTVVTINGSPNPPLAAGAYIEVTLTAASVVTSNFPVMMAQYCKGTTIDGVVSDPFEMLIPPTEQFAGDYTFSTPATGFSKNFINVVLPTADLGNVTLDGFTLGSGSFSAIGASGYHGAKIPVGLGTHTLSGPLAFGVSVYGYDAFDSYGYPGGVLLAAVATVASLSLSPKTGSQMTGIPHCVTATVLDSATAPVVGARVDFSVGGANARAGFAYTNAAGQAVYCWTGGNAGTDSILASLAGVSDTASMDWFVYTPTVSPTFSHSPTPSPTRTVSATRTSSPTRTPTPTNTPTRTATLTRTPSQSFTPTQSFTASPSNSPTWTSSPTVTATFTPSPTPSISPTHTISPTPVEQDRLMTLRGVYPMPFSETGHIYYVLKTDADMEFSIFNVAGEMVLRRRVSARAGANLMDWLGANESGKRVASGIYLAHLTADSTSLGRDEAWARMVVAR